MSDGHPHTNRLIDEKSPYLLQHAHNPVDWHPWGGEAFERARREDKPIFLSVGYSTCHWCHVMERESFENEDIAAVLNAHFVCIKVDREERPDVDNVYMDAVQAMTGQGGWPMSVWLTPDLKPFYAGTYFPPTARGGMPGFADVCLQLHAAWTERREEVLNTAGQIQDHLAAGARSFVAQGKMEIDSLLLDKAYAHLESTFDARKGGFGRAPKFPTPHKVRFLFRTHRRTGERQALAMARKTLDEMALGGIHDHLGGGFHRYSTDSDWLVPHFEKMLYDQAGLALAYTDAYRVTGSADYAAVARGICDYVLRDLTDSRGGLYSAEDADSEGEEGTFYVWRAEEVREVLGEESGDAFLEAYNATEAGNWESVNILHAANMESLRNPGMVEAREKLLAARSARERPHLDDKILTAWNGAMIEALACAGNALEESAYIEAASRAAAFLDDHLVQDGRLLRSYREGASDIKGFLDDYAFLALGRLALFEATFEPRHLERAKALCADMLTLFRREDGSFDFLGADQDTLITPAIEIYDGAMPSANSAAAMALLRVGHLTADSELKDAGWDAVRVFSGSLDRNPSAHLAMLAAADFAVGPATEIILAAEDTEALEPLRRLVARGYHPNAVVAAVTEATRDAAEALIPYLASQGPQAGKPTAYVCRNYACRLPVHTVSELRDQLR